MPKIKLYWVDRGKKTVGVLGHEEHEPVHISAFFLEEYEMVPMPVRPVSGGRPTKGSPADAAHRELFE